MASVLNKSDDEGETSGSNLTSMKLSDCSCPICMYILIEPVTMPCGHEMCMSCFKKNVQESSLTCPMCRVRISTWARRAAKNNTLINQERWRAIQEAFPTKVSNILNGKDDESSSDEETEVWVNLSKPGEIRQEYEKELKRVENERRKQQQAELEANAKALKELGDDELQAAKRRELELEKQMEADELLARKLQSDLNVPVPPMSDSTADVLRMLEERSKSSTSASSRSTSRSSSRVMDKFLAKGKRQKESQQNQSPYPYTCASPSEKNEENDQTETYETMEDKVLRESLIEIFGPPVSESPQASPLEEMSNTAKSNVCTTTTKDQSSQRDSTSSKRATPEACSSSKGGEKEVMLPPDKPPDVVRCTDDSITQELVHFRPIHASPKTPPRRLPGGRFVEPKIIRSTPINQGKMAPPKNQDAEEEENITESHPGMQSPVMQKRLKELATERRFQVVAQSKSTSTEAGSSSRNIDTKFWNPSEEKLRNTVKSATATASSPSNVPTTSNLSGKVSIQSLFKKKVAAAATVASSSADDIHLPPPTDDLPNLPDLCVTVISDSEDDDVMEVKAILPLESNVDDDLLHDAEPLTLSNLTKLLASSEVFGESLPASEYSPTSGQLYIADGGQSDKDSKSEASKRVIEDSKMSTATSERDLRCNSSSKPADDLSRASSANPRPVSDVPSVLTSELLSSASRSSCSSQSPHHDDVNSKRLEVNLKVIDESARMEPATGDSNSLLGANLLQISKPSESGDNPSHQNVACVLVGPSPSEFQPSTSRSNDKEQFTSIKEWFKKWSAPANSSSKDDEVDADTEAPKIVSMVITAPTETTITKEAVSNSSTVSKQNCDVENSLQDSSKSTSEGADHLDALSKTDVPTALPSTSSETVEKTLEDVMKGPEVVCDQFIVIQKKLEQDDQTTSEQPQFHRQTSESSVIIPVVHLKRGSQKGSPRKKKVSTKSPKGSKRPVVQPQVKRSSRPKKINERFTKDYVVESPVISGMASPQSTVKNGDAGDIDDDTDIDDDATDTEVDGQPQSSPHKLTAVQSVKKNLFDKAKASKTHVVESTTADKVGKKIPPKSAPRKRKLSTKEDSVDKPSPRKTPKKASPQKRTPAKRLKRAQKNKDKSAATVKTSPVKKAKKVEDEDREPSPAKTRSRKTTESKDDDEDENEEAATPVKRSSAKNTKKVEQADKEREPSPVETRRTRKNTETRDADEESEDDGVESPTKSPSKAKSKVNRSPKKAVKSARSPVKSVKSPVKSPVKGAKKVPSSSKNPPSVVALRTRKTSSSVAQSPKRKISEVDEPITPQKKMLRRITESSCVAQSDEDKGDEDADATVLYKVQESDDEDDEMKNEQSVSSKTKCKSNSAKCSPIKGRTSKLGRARRTRGKTQVYREVSVDEDDDSEVDVTKSKHVGRERKGSASDTKDTIGKPPRKKQNAKIVNRISRSKGASQSTSGDCSPHSNTKTKVDEDKENEVDDVFLETNVKKSSARGNSRVKVDSDSPCITPKKKEGEFLVEYSPRSCGKKVVINKIPRKRTTAQRQLKLSSHGTLDPSDTEDFAEEPIKKRRVVSAKKGARPGGKQMTLHDLFGKQKPETSGEKCEKSAKSALRKGRAKRSPKKAKQTGAAKSKSPEKTEESVCKDEPEDCDDSASEIDEQPRCRSDFASEKDYKAYLEQRDMQMAMQLQAEYEFEARYKLSCDRRKGSENSYSFRRK